MSTVSRSCQPCWRHPSIKFGEPRQNGAPGDLTGRIAQPRLWAETSVWRLAPKTVISAPGRLACAWPVTYSTPNAHEHICAFIGVVSCGAVRPAGQNTAKPTGLAVGPQDSGMLSSLGWHPNTRTTRPTGSRLKNSVADNVADNASRLLAPAGPEGSVLAEGPSGNPPAP